MFNHLTPKTPQQIEESVNEMLKPLPELSSTPVEDVLLASLQRFINDPYNKIFSNLDSIFKTMDVKVSKYIRYMCFMAIYNSKSFKEAKKKVKSLIFLNKIRVISFIAFTSLLIVEILAKFVIKNEQLFQLSFIVYWISIICFWIVTTCLLIIGRKRKKKSNYDLFK